PHVDEDEVADAVGDAVGMDVRRLVDERHSGPGHHGARGVRHGSLDPTHRRLGERWAAGEQQGESASPPAQAPLAHDRSPPIQRLQAAIRLGGCAYKSPSREPSCLPPGCLFVDRDLTRAPPSRSVIAYNLDISYID